MKKKIDFRSVSIFMAVVAIFLFTLCAASHADRNLNQNEEWIFQPNEVRFKIYDLISGERIGFTATQSLGFLEMIGTKMELDHVLCNVAKIHEDLGNINEALKYYMRAQKVQKELENQERLVTTLNNIGALYLKKGEIQKAMNYHDQSYDIATESNYTSGQIQSLLHIGHVFLKKDEFSTARTYYTDALERARSSGDEYGELDSLSCAL